MSATLHQRQKPAQLETRLHHAITTKTHRCVRRLAVSAKRQYVVVQGKAPSYYVAQLALAAAQQVMRTQRDARPVRLAITVEKAIKV